MHTSSAARTRSSRRSQARLRAERERKLLVFGAFCLSSPRRFFCQGVMPPEVPWISWTLCTRFLGSRQWHRDATSALPRSVHHTHPLQASYALSTRPMRCRWRSCAPDAQNQAKEGARLQGNLGQRRGPAQGRKFHMEQLHSTILGF